MADDVPEMTLQPADPRAASLADGETDGQWRAASPGGAAFWRVREGGADVGSHVAPGRTTWIAARAVRFTELADVERRSPSQGSPPASSPADEALDRALNEAWAPRLGQAEDFVQYALPSESEWQRGRFAGFDIVRTMGLLALPLSADGPETSRAGVAPLEHPDEQIRWLWDRCAGSFGAGAIRDADTFRWRFGDGRASHAMGVRDEHGVLRGYAVVRNVAWFGAPCAVVLDWLVPPEEPEVGAQLLAAVRAQARADGVDRVVSFLVEWSPWFTSFQDAGFRVHPSPLFLVARSAARRFDHLWLRDHWWWTLADATVV